jgi:hypothetical protein
MGSIDYFSVPDPTSSNTPNPSANSYQDAVLSAAATNVPRVVSAPGQISTSDTTTTTTQNKPTSPGGRRRQTAKSGGETTVKRRQKRLERNRESARLSRRRRKQYLEVLEENVNKLSHELDQGRREHVSRAVQTIHNKRIEILAGKGENVENLGLLQNGLSRTSGELMVVNTFQSQQLRSFVMPPSTKFTLWLTLQNDEYYRGGRASSERLSAARIGERVRRTRNFGCLSLMRRFKTNLFLLFLFNRCSPAGQIEWLLVSRCGLCFATK